MSLNKTHYLENKLMSATFNATAFSVTTVYAGLFTVAPSKTGGGTEVSTTGTAYARQALVPNTVTGALSYTTQDASGSKLGFSTVTFPTATGSGYGTVLAMGFFDAATGGNLLYYDTFTGVAVGAGVQPQYASGNLTITEG